MKPYSSTMSGGARIGAPTELPVTGNPLAKPLFFGFVLLAALFLVIRPSAPFASTLVIAVAPLLAAVAASRVAALGPTFHRSAWILVAIAGLIASAGYVLEGTGAGTTANGSVLSQAIPLLWTLLFMAGAARLLPSANRPTIETVVDATVVLVAAAVAVCHWTPAGQLLLVAPAGTIGTHLLVVLPSIAMLATVMALGAGGATAAGLRTGLGAIVLAALMFFVGSVAITASRGVHAALVLGGWAALSFGALQVQRDGEALLSASAAGALRLRQIIGPGVALLMAATLIHCAFGHPLRAPTSIALAVLSSLLALRMTELLKATRQHSEERRELAQKRALVEVSTALAGSTDLHATLELVTTWTCRLLNTQAAAIELVREDGEALVMQAAVGLPERVIGMQFPVNGSFTGWVVQKREPRATADPSTDPFISGDSLTLLGRSPTAAAPMRCRDHVLGALSCIGTRPFTPDDLELLQALADQAAVAIENARLFEQVHALSVTDPLTNLSNRRQLERDLSREFAAARRGRQLVAVMFDLNGFKDYNDRHGHLAGDQALRAFADALAQETRAMNLAVRYGGDEFLVLLADADLEGTAVFIQRIRDRFTEAITRLGVEGLGFAAGIAEYHTSMRDATELIAAADRALYQVKRAST